MHSNNPFCAFVLIYIHKFSSLTQPLLAVVLEIIQRFLRHHQYLEGKTVVRQFHISSAKVHASQDKYGRNLIEEACLGYPNVSATKMPCLRGTNMAA
jgi:hypothetical protein